MDEKRIEEQLQKWIDVCGERFVRQTEHMDDKQLQKWIDVCGDYSDGKKHPNCKEGYAPCYRCVWFENQNMGGGGISYDCNLKECPYYSLPSDENLNTGLI